MNYELLQTFWVSYFIVFQNKFLKIPVKKEDLYKE